MTVYLVVLLSMLNSIGQRGSKVAISLYALELGAGAAAVGVLAALFATFPLLLAVQAGRISDRFGVRIPIVCGALTMAAGLAVAFTVSRFTGSSSARRSSAWGTSSSTSRSTTWSARSAPKPSARATSRPSPSAARSLRSSDRRSPASPSTRRLPAGLCHPPARGRRAGAVVLAHRSLIPARVRHEEEEQAKSASTCWRSRRCAARSS